MVEAFSDYLLFHMPS